jgi:hypothetical protein
MFKKLRSLVLCLLLLLTFTSCNLFIAQPGTLSLSFEQSLSKTIEPTSTEISITKFKISGSGPDSQSFVTEFLNYTDTSSKSIDGLSAGSWNVTVNGYNDDEIPKIIASKTVEVIILSGATTEKTITLEFLEGTGSMELSINWPDSIKSLNEIRGTLIPTVEGKDSFSVVTSGATLSDGRYTIPATIEDLPTGTYTLAISFWDANSAQMGPDFYNHESLNIYKDRISTGTISIPENILTVEDPITSLVAGTYDSPQSVSLSCETQDATIYYTTDNTAPTAISSVYSSAISLAENTTIKAVAIEAGKFSSAIISNEYLIKTSAPEFSLETGTFDVAQSVTITSTDGSTIHYTIDNSTPNIESNSIASGESISISATCTLKAISIKNNMEASPVSSIDYTINGVAQLSIIAPNHYTLSIEPPEGWIDGLTNDHSNATLNATLSPIPQSEDVTFSWYIDGIAALNNAGEAVPNTSSLEFGLTDSKTDIEAGVHMIQVEVLIGDIKYSDSYIISALATTPSSSFITRVINENEIEITDFIGTEAEVIVPVGIDGKNVTSIGDRAFDYSPSLTSVVILDGVTSIDDCAFLDCSRLVSVKIPDGVTFIGNCTFSGCRALTTINIPESVTFIDNFAFKNCSSLTSFVILESVEIIGGYAFSGCSNLLNINCYAAEEPIEWASRSWLAGYEGTVTYGYTGD